MRHTRLLILLLLLAALGGPALSQRGPEKESLAGLKQRAKSGDDTAQFELGVAYAKGVMVTQSLAHAARWYRKAAEQGNLAAQLALAHALQRGEGVERDPTEAFHWYERLAERRVAPAQLAVALAYLRGQGTERNPDEGVRRLEELAKQGDPPSLLALADCYQKGEAVAKNLETAEGFLKIAAETDDPESQYRYAVALLEKGQDQAKALRLLESSERAGYQPATTYLTQLRSSQQGGQTTPPPTRSKDTPIPILIAGAVLALLVVLAHRYQLDLSLTKPPAQAVSLPGVLKGPDLQIDVKVAGEEELTGWLTCQGERVTVKLEKELSSAFWLQGLLGHFSGASRRPSSADLKAIAQGTRTGKPITLVPVGDDFRANFSFDCGPSLDEFRMIYNPRTRALQVQTDCLATAWDGDDFRSRRKTSGKTAGLLGRDS